MSMMIPDNYKDMRLILIFLIFMAGLIVISYAAPYIWSQERSVDQCNDHYIRHIDQHNIRFHDERTIDNLEIRQYNHST